MTLFRGDSMPDQVAAHARMNRGWSIAVTLGLIAFALWALAGCVWAFPTTDPPYLVRVVNGVVIDLAERLGVLP